MNERRFRMLTEERHSIILNQLRIKEMITVTELVEHLETSESTIRRDLMTLEQLGYLKRVHGGAILKDKKLSQIEYKVDKRQTMNKKEKIAIAKKAASFIQEGDVIYVDAGTTTECLIEYIKAKDIIVVTNGLNHAKELLGKGVCTYILGGKIKHTTQAVIGADAVKALDKYNFSKGFFGANGVSVASGYTTPDVTEGAVKQKAIKKCQEVYILADDTKLETVSFMSFARIDEAILITNGIGSKRLKDETKVIEVTPND